MTKFKISDARKDLAEIINRVAYGDERIILERRGKGLAAVIPINDLELLEAIEDRIDLDEAKKALADPKNKRPIPWEKVKKDLGL